MSLKAKSNNKKLCKADAEIVSKELWWSAVLDANYQN
jgi:hypothetical protein